MPQIQDIHAHIRMPKNSHPSLPATCLMLLPPWCTAITGYHINSIISNSQQQPTASYRQTSKLLPGANWPTRVKTTTNRIYTWQFKYANTMPIYSMHKQWFNLWLYHWHSLLPVEERSIITWNLSQSIGILCVISHILYLIIIPICCWLFTTHVH